MLGLAPWILPTDFGNETYEFDIVDPMFGALIAPPDEVAQFLDDTFVTIFLYQYQAGGRRAQGH